MATFAGMSWQKWNIHGHLLVYFVLESCRIIAFGQITNIRLAENETSYIGKVEISTTSCIPDLTCSDDGWYTVCHDGDGNVPSWNHEAATAACKQLGYEAGWNISETGLSEYYTIEGFHCTDQSASLAECTSADTEYCGCNGGYTGLLCLSDYYSYTEQAAVECFKFTDVSLHLKNVGSKEKKLNIEYRGEVYDVCFRGASKDWSMDEADVACRQMGYPQGALSTSPAASRLPRSFADFSCDGDESNLFSCISKPPRSESCEDDNIVSLTCQDGTETSSISTTIRGDFNTGKGEMRTQQQLNLGFMIGVSVGGTAVIILILVVVLLLLRRQSLRNKDKTKDNQPVIGADGYAEYKANSEGDTHVKLGGINPVGTESVDETYEDVTGTEEPYLIPRVDEGGFSETPDPIPENIAGKSDGQDVDEYSYPYADVPSRPTKNNVLECNANKESIKAEYVDLI